MSSIIATNLDNSIIGGPNDQRNAIRFQAQHSSPLAAFRCYVIDNAPGYSSGTGGVLMADLSEDDAGKPGTVQAVGYKIADPEYPDPSSGRGRFPLVIFESAKALVKGHWYWIVVGNDDKTPSVNYFSMDYLMNSSKTNQVPTAGVYLSTGNGPFNLVPYLIPSPLVFHYANGLWQGIGYIAAVPTLEPGTEYGFPAASCI